MYRDSTGCDTLSLARRLLWDLYAKAEWRSSWLRVCQASSIPWKIPPPVQGSLSTRFSGRAAQRLRSLTDGPTSHRSWLASVSSQIYQLSGAYFHVSQVPYQQVCRASLIGELAEMIALSPFSVIDRRLIRAKGAHPDTVGGSRDMRPIRASRGLNLIAVAANMGHVAASGFGPLAARTGDWRTSSEAKQTCLLFCACALGG
jgi:hypothetical protein